jgi:type III secretory pathway component EscU
LPTIIVPFFKEKLRTERSVLELLEALLEVAALALLVWVWLAPKVEKFHPDCERSNVTLGSSIVKPVT